LAPVSKRFGARTVIITDALKGIILPEKLSDRVPMIGETLQHTKGTLFDYRNIISQVHTGLLKLLDAGH
jgi:hypothetical protein